MKLFLVMLLRERTKWSSLSSSVLQNYAISFMSNLGSSVMVRWRMEMDRTAWALSLKSFVSHRISSTRILSQSYFRNLRYSNFSVKLSHILCPIRPFLFFMTIDLRFRNLCKLSFISEDSSSITSYLLDLEGFYAGSSMTKEGKSCIY